MVILSFDKALSVTLTKCSYKNFIIKEQTNIIVSHVVIQKYSQEL